MALKDRTLADLLTAFSSSAPTPGGGSASALASALGASLLVMVAGLPRTRRGSADERESLDDAGERLSGLRDRLTDLIDRDSEAYDAVVAAYRLPRTSGNEKATRSAAVQAALALATEVPLETMRATADAIRAGVIVAGAGHRGAASDIGVAFDLLTAGLRGAARNVRINLEGLSDRGRAAAIAAEAAELERAGATEAARAEELFRD